MTEKTLDRKDLTRALSVKANILRRHCIRSTTKAGSGHPTTCLSAADLVAALFFHAMRFDLRHPDHPVNDRFVLSKGHAAPLLYAAWAEAGAFPADHLMTLRKVDSDLEGHPTPRFRHAEVATGSLGQGLSIGAGMALAGKIDALPYRVYVLLGDGEVAEGAVWEAAAFASYYQLGNLTAIVDVNRLGQSQPTMLQHDIDRYAERFSAFGWFVEKVDGHDMDALINALDRVTSVTDKPTVILAKTVKGKGAPEVEDKDGWHGKALPSDLAERALANLQGDESDHLLASSLTLQPPDGSFRLKDLISEAQEPIGTVSLPRYKKGAMVATREAYGDALVALGAAYPDLVVLDGDVKNSTFSEKFFAAYPDRFFECFIAEQNMVGVAVGLAARGKRPFLSSFACFLTRAFDFIRMAAIGRAQIRICGSHAGVSIGEDGPSQMGLEDLAMMRAIPKGVVLYPCDAVSCVHLVNEMARYNGISYIRTTRPKTPVLYDNEEEFPIGGCKVLRSSPKDRLTIVAAGVTVFESLKAAQILSDKGISVRVVDLYSVKPIDKNTLLSCARETGNLVVTVEDHYPEGGLGEAVASAVAPEGIRVHQMAVGDIPRSGKPEELMDLYGISARHIVAKVLSLVKDDH
ncbi:MAG: transketolase [Armatimonadetes bacterium]|nr:transketolase [Armatimonadota bacterium]MDW8122134.1 transketolase [Armatimonadota bacterium]